LTATLHRFVVHLSGLDLAWHGWPPLPQRRWWRRRRR